MKAALTLLLVSVSTLFAQAQTVSGSGGTFTSPTAIGSNITITGVTLTNGSVVDLNCPVTFFGAGTYQWNWHCSGGKLEVDGKVIDSVSGSVQLTCRGGGRAHPTTCYHVFNGTRGNGTPVYAQAKGGANNAPGTVTVFTMTE